jgi:hypothetical protein
MKDEKWRTYNSYLYMIENIWISLCPLKGCIFSLNDLKIKKTILETTFSEGWICHFQVIWKRDFLKKQLFHLTLLIHHYWILLYEQKRSVGGLWTRNTLKNKILLLNFDFFFFVGYKNALKCWKSQLKYCHQWEWDVFFKGMYELLILKELFHHWDYSTIIQ